MLILHARRSQMHAITNIFPPSPTSVFKAGKCISPLYIFCYFFVLGDTHMDHYLRINELKSGVLFV